MRIRLPISLLGAGLVASVGLAAQAANAAASRLASDVVVISPATVQQELISVTKHGTTYTFKAAAGGLQYLRAGKVMMFQGRDVVKVAKVRHVRGHLVIVTVPAKLTDVMRSGTIRFSGAPDTARAFLASDAASSPMASYTGSDVRSARAAAAPRIELNGKVGDYTYQLTFTPSSAGRLDYTGNIGYNAGFTATIGIAGYIGLGHDTVNVAVNGGNVAKSNFSFDNLVAHTHVTYTLASGTQKGVGNPPILRIPVVIDVPIAGTPVPIFVRLSAAVILKFGITSYNATIQGGSDVTVSGSDSITQNGSHVSESQTGDQATGSILTHEGGSVGPSSSALASAVVVGFSLPKIGVGLGVSSLNGLAYLNLVTTITQITQPAALGLAGVDCSSYELEVQLTAGLESQLGRLGITSPPKTLGDWKAGKAETGCPPVSPPS